MLLLTSTDTLGLSHSLVRLGGWGQGFGPSGAWARMRRGLLLLLNELRGALLRLLLRLMGDDCFRDCSFLGRP